MRTKLYIVIAVLISTLTFAQQGINYKALIKDSTGDIIANTSVIIQFRIQTGTQTMNLLYEETHTTSTDNSGIAIVNIGQGTVSSGSGNFESINWENGNRFLNVQIDTGNGLIDLGTTEFMAVPYALSASNVSGLELISEGNNDGYRLIGRNALYYGNVGNDAVDFSASDTQSTSFGAIGNNAIAFGITTKASGIGSLATGRNTEANAGLSTAMGFGSQANSIYGTAIGTYNLGIGSSSLNLPTNALFEVGNGVENFRSNALTILNNGTILAPSFDIAEITNSKALITKEYLETNTGSGLDIISENGNTGWRLRGQTSNSYGFIGNNAVDLSISSIPSTNNGATGDNSTAFGNITEASGFNSTAMGSQTTASGVNSVAMNFNTSASGLNTTALGIDTNADSFSSLAIGMYNIGGGNALQNIDTDPLFEIGNGTSTTSRNALTVLKNGSHIIKKASADVTHIILEGSSNTTVGDDSRISSDPSLSGSDLFLRSNDAVIIELDADDDEAGQFEIRRADGTVVFDVFEDGRVRQNGATIHSSDRRLKKDIETIPYGLKEILQLKPKAYN